MLFCRKIGIKADCRGFPEPFVSTKSDEVTQDSPLLSQHLFMVLLRADVLPSTENSLGQR